MNMTREMNINIKRGEFASGTVEKFHFTTRQQAADFLTTNVPQMTLAQLREILTSEDTQFSVPGIANHAEVDALYTTMFRYEITVESF